MDYKELDIFQKEKFQLYSKTRDRHFRFIRYNGRNYDEIVSFIHGLSPNTEIWPEERLKVGILYNYSGRSFKMGYVDDISLRGVIVNNPFIVSENGEKILLAFNRDEAVSYLSLSSTHAVFCPQKALATFKMDHNDGKLYEYSIDHPKGINRERLSGNEFYICRGTVTDSLYKAKFEKDPHELIITYQYKELVERFEKAKYDINRLYSLRVQSEHTEHKYIFEPTWDNWLKRDFLSKRCLNSLYLPNIIKTLRSVVIDETDGGNQLDAIKLRNHPFVKEIESLYGYFIMEELKSKKVEKIFLKYYDSTDDPACPQDFENLQKRLYEHFRVFLNNVLDKVKERKTGTILLDKGYIICCDTLLPEYLSGYMGCICSFTDYQENTTKGSPYKYECKSIDYIEKIIEGVAEVDKKGVLVVDKYKLPDDWPVSAGTPVKITKIKPDTHNGHGVYSGVAVDMLLVRDNNPDFLKIINIKGSDNKRSFFFKLVNLFQKTKSKKEIVFIMCAAQDKKLIKKWPSYTEFKEAFGDRLDSDKLPGRATWDNNHNAKNESPKDYHYLFEEWETYEKD